MEKDAHGELAMRTICDRGDFAVLLRRMHSRRTTKPAFEVATIKPAPPPDGKGHCASEPTGGPGTKDPGPLVVARTSSLGNLIAKGLRSEALPAFPVQTVLENRFQRGRQGAGRSYQGAVPI